MGILKTEEDRVVVRLEDHLQDYMFDSPDPSDNEESPEEEIQSAPVTPRRRRRASYKSGGSKKRYTEFLAFQGAGGAPQGGRRSRLGQRKQRRFENARNLASLVDPDDICWDLTDTLPETISAFTQLFLERDNMRIWNEFVEKSEEEQVSCLQDGKEGAGCSSSSAGRRLGGKPSSAQRSGDSRSTHPAYSGEACFRRVDARFRHLLSQKHLPWGKLESFEAALLDFFTEFPDGVWVQLLESGYDRLLCHATAQYLSLKSQSYNSEGGKRETQVENPKPFFVPPRETLVDYLQARQRTS